MSSKPENDLVVVRVNGDLVSTTAASVRGEIDTAISAADEARSWSVFQLDLATAKMIDSVGLNLVVSLLKRLQARERRLQVTYCDPNVLRTLTFTRLDKQIELVKI